MDFKKLKQKWEAGRIHRIENSNRIRKVIQRSATPIFQKYGVKRAILFGSVAQNRWKGNSDVDLFVEALPNEHYWEIRREIEEAIDCRVDLYTDKDDPVFIGKVIERGEVVYEI